MDGEPFERYPEFEEIHTNRRQYVTVNRQQPSAPEMDDDSSPRPPSYSPDVPTPPPEYPLAIPAHLTAPIATSPQKRRKVVEPVVLSIRGTPAARHLDVAANFVAGLWITNYRKRIVCHKLQGMRMDVLK